MALTFSGRKAVVGDRQVWRGKVTFDSSYPTGGEAIAGSDFGFPSNTIEHVQVAAERGSEVVVWDSAAETLEIYTADGVEAANASNQSAVTAHVTVTGL
jgi:hypothetical protein